MLLLAASEMGLHCLHNTPKRVNVIRGHFARSHGAVGTMSDWRSRGTGFDTWSGDIF